MAFLNHGLDISITTSPLGLNPIRVFRIDNFNLIRVDIFFSYLSTAWSNPNMGECPRTRYITK